MAAASRIESFWYSQSVWKWLLWPFSQLFFGLTFLKYFLYKNRFISVSKNKVPVLVVGNITVGGTGKTPFIILLANLLKQQGLRIGIVSRGYHSQAPSYPHRIGAQDTVKTVGDEAFMLYGQLALPMVINADRSRAVALLTNTTELDLIISDDGLQHYKMARDIELLLVDSNRGFGNKLSIPFGPLRESTWRLKHVDLIVQNGGQQLLSEVASALTPSILMSIETLALIHVQTGNPVALANLKEQSVHAVCGIGNPQRFFNSLKPLCQNITPWVFADHHDFVAEDFSKLDEKLVIMTEKDAVKCREFAQSHWYFLKVGASISDEAGEKLLHIITDKLNGN